MNEKIKLSIETALKNAKPKSTGKCGTFVRMAVETGFKLQLTRASCANLYGPSYEKIGFKQILQCSTKSIGVEKYKEEIKKYNPELGDIAIVKYEPYGHISIHTNKGSLPWTSDFNHRDFYGGSVRNKLPDVFIYRYIET